MFICSFQENLQKDTGKVRSKLILETAFTKEIRIEMSSGQRMKEHQTPFPIVVHLLKGEIDFGVKGETHRLLEGSIIGLEGGIPHDLIAHEDSVIRLSLSKTDKVERVDQLVKNG